MLARTKRRGSTSATPKSPSKCRGNLRVGLSGTSNYGVASLWDNTANSGTGACVFAHSTRRDLFYTQLSDSSLWHLPLDEYGGFSWWESWGKRSGVSLTSKPGMASWSNGRIDGFAYDSSGNVSHVYWASPGPPGWNSWDKPSGYTLIKSPDATSWRPGRIDVSVLAQSGATVKVFHRYWDNNYWSGWQDWGSPAGITLASRAAMAAWNFGRIDIFALSNAATPDVWHGVSTDGNTLAGWNNWGHPAGQTLLVNDAIDVSSWGDQRLDVFVGDTNLNVWHIYYDNGYFSSWELWGHPYSEGLFGQVGAVGGGEGRMWMAAKGTVSLQLEEENYTGNAFGPWVNRGGTPWLGPDLSSW